MRRRRAAAGLGVAVAVVALFVYGVGWERVLEHVRDAEPGVLVVAAVLGLGILLFRGAVVKRLLGPVDGSARGGAFVTAFLAGYFARSALPWGRSTGTPVTAFLLASNSDSEFEDNLAVVAAAEAFNLVGSVLVTAVGLVALVTLTDAVSTPDELSRNVAVVGGSGLLAAGALAVVLERGRVRDGALALASRCESAAERLPRVSDAEGTLTRRLEGFVGTLEAIQADRRTLAAALAIATAGWIVNAAPLYVCLLALGVDAPFALALLCAPLASLGGVVPLPGGTGGIEVVLASLLVATAGIAGDAATAAAILYRLTTYWLNLGIAGLGAVYLTVSGANRSWVEP